MPKKVLLTVFTPVYNRAHLIINVYNSLKVQNNRNFEWVVVDDGSKDNIDEVMKDIIYNEKEFSILFFRKENGGKHTAINLGLRNSKGKLFFILDSDDYLTPDATAIIENDYPIIENLENIAGLGYNRVYSNGETIGGARNYETLNTSYIDYHYVKKYSGDKAEVFKTEILKQFSFPENEERFCPEALVWRRMGGKYNLLYINKGIYVCEYLEGGLTDNSIKLRYDSPKNTSLFYGELANDKKLPFAEKIKAVINYWRFAISDNSKTFVEKLKNIKLWWAILLYPISYIIYLREK